MTDLTDNYALITGATSGIGYELAKIFAENGYNLIAVARTQTQLERVADELSQLHGIKVITLAKDLFRRESPFEVYEKSAHKIFTSMYWLTMQPRVYMGALSTLIYKKSWTCCSST